MNLLVYPPRCLHYLSSVPGHSLERLALHRTLTTQTCRVILVKCTWKKSLIKYEGGSLGLCHFLDDLVQDLEQDCYCPPSFETVCVPLEQGTEPANVAPITVGCELSLRAMSNMRITHDDGNITYTVPVECPLHRFRSPVGLGSTLVGNSVVMKFPGVAQYLIPETMRVPQPKDVGFLCCCSSSTSASLKGIIRYTVSGTECRVFSLGVNECFRQMIGVFTCGCKDEHVESDYITLEIAGIEFRVCIHLWSKAVRLLRDRATTSPHVPTFDVLQSKVVISFCTGTLMKRTNGMWKDSNTIRGGVTAMDTIYDVVAPALQFIPFVSSIHPARASLVNVYLEQAVCYPWSSYIQGITFAPNYTEQPVFVTDVVSPQVESIGKLLPGLNLRVLFCNTGLTYEDGMVLSNSAALRFQYTAEHSITLSLFQTRGMFIDGTVQAGSQPWWQFPYDGVITTLEPTRLGKIMITGRRSLLVKSTRDYQQT
jgi:hypothetical protein